MKYRKKPVVIEAFQYDGDLSNAPEWIHQALSDGTMKYGAFTNSYFSSVCELYIKTLEGNMCVDKYDYIIQGVEGELYPCKPDIFKKTYELVEE